VISQREVQRLAFEQRVPEQMIERDYVLSWLLAALGSPTQSPHLITKGGTAIKKLYFADWRYSEDLDFSCADRMGADDAAGLLDRACRHVQAESGLEVVVGSTEPRETQGGLRSLTAYLDYIGPLRRTRRARQLKVDLTFDEIIVSAPATRTLIRSFSDEPEPAPTVMAYPLEEIVAEKMRTLLQRTEARDLYDVWRILSQYTGQVDDVQLATILEAKCSHRGLSSEDVAVALTPDRAATYERAWEHRLGQQVRDIPPLDAVVRETRRLLRRLVGG